jgi:O-antigen/teichoic acid export membrane protein
MTDAPAPPPPAAPPPPTSLARIAGGSAVYLMAGKALTLGTVLLLSAILPLAAFGEVMYARGIVLFAGPFMALGLTVTAMQRIPAYLETGDSARALGFLRTLTITVLTVSALTALAIVLTAPLILPEPRATVLRAAAAALPGFAALVAHMQAARATGRVTLAYAMPSLGQPLAFATGATAAIWGFGVTSPVAIAAIFSASMLTAAGIQLAGIARMAEFRGTNATTERRTWLVQALPLTLSLAAQGVTASGPLLILGLHADGATLGIFGFYQAAMQGLLIFNTSIFGATNPRLSRRLAALPRDRGAVRGLLRRSRGAATGVTVAGGAVAAGLILGYGDLVQPAFTTEPAALLLLLGAVAVNATAGPLGHVLIIEGRRGWEIATQAACAALTVGVALWLIPAPGPWGGLTGAALATMAAALLRSALAHALVFGRLGYRL